MARDELKLSELHSKRFFKFVSISNNFNITCTRPFVTFNDSCEDDLELEMGISLGCLRLVLRRGEEKEVPM